MLVLAHAATGDVEQTVPVANKMRPQRFFLTTCYQDEDLGPILRSESFHAFREKYPEPKAKPGLGRDFLDP